MKQADILSADGKLTNLAIQNSKEIFLSDTVIKNPTIIKQLTGDGSAITDWAKFKTQSVAGPNGSSLQVHFYKNKVTGKIDYDTPDYKVKGVIPTN